MVYGGGVRIDLHAHSSHSDGTDSPADVVAAASAARLDVVALTDHDVTSGWSQAAEAGSRLGVSVVPGVEISCSWRSVSVHLLGYLFDFQHPELVAEMERARHHRVTRLRTMVEALAADGYPVTWEAILDSVPAGVTLGRPHLADALVAAGSFPDRAAAFASVLHRDSPYYASHYAPAPTRAVTLVRRAGGVPVMAHPFAHARGAVVPDSVIGDMVDAGLVGLEVDHRDHTDAARRKGRELAARHGLLVTGSSDYHGAGKPNRLGENLTEPEVLEQILAGSSGAQLMGAPLRSHAD